MSPLQGQDGNIICFAEFFLQHESLHPPSVYSPAPSFKHILSDCCNCTMTEPIPHPHQSLQWRYGLLPNMTPSSLLPTLPILLGLPPCFTGIVINNRSNVQSPSSQPRFPGLHPIGVGAEIQCIE